ncbi:MAG: putative protein of unknown function acetylesterase [Fibrobacteres bacterium]|nr:putative protein of unknown function acetylesterase [Fibrobacterota bacterium]
MMDRIRALPPFRALTALVLVVSACSGPTEHEARGGTTDTGNTIVALAGEVLAQDGGPAGRSDLSLRRSDYLSPLPLLGKIGTAMKRGAASESGRKLRDQAAARAEIALLDTFTDASGAFRLDSLDSGSYRLEVRQGNGLGLVYDAAVVPDTAALVLPGRKLEKTAAIGGTILLRPDAVRAYVQVYGMERLSAVNTATGRFDLPLPAGRFMVRFVDPEGGAATVKVREITLAPGDSLDMGQVDLRDSTAPYLQWTHSRRLWINTTAGGADVASAVYGFPMLVRLDSNLIDFSQTNPGGSDLRFTKAGDKTPLAYEIERWDAAARTAEVWVRMDTIEGNSSDQYIHMHWGNGAAQDSSAGASVFDTALGFAGVWHLKEGSNEAGFPGYLDATSNRNTGKGVAISDTTVGPGLIGRGQRLDGKGAYIRVPDAPSLNPGSGDFCVSAWVRPDAIFRPHQVISKRVDAGGDYEIQLRADGHVETYVGNTDVTKPLPSAKTLSAGEWHLLAMRRSGTVISFFLDGVPDTSFTAPAAADLDNAADFFIGHDAQGLSEDWQGALDEIRFSRKAMAPEWLLLSYRNQAPGSKMLSPLRP